MNIKIFEVRDRMTFLPLVAVKVKHTPQEGHMLIRTGWIDEEPIFIFDLQAEHVHFECYDRTRGVALKYIKDNWDTLVGGEVIDIEFLLGETTEKQRSEREKYHS